MQPPKATKFVVVLDRQSASQYTVTRESLLSRGHSRRVLDHLNLSAHFLKTRRESGDLLFLLRQMLLLLSNLMAICLAGAAVILQGRHNLLHLG